MPPPSQKLSTRTGTRFILPTDPFALPLLKFGKGKEKAASSSGKAHLMAASPALVTFWFPRMGKIQQHFKHAAQTKHSTCKHQQTEHTD